MPRNPPMTIQFPRLGVVRRFGHTATGKQGEFGSPYSMNCRLEDSLTNRLRGGSFTGISAGARPASIVYRDRTLTFSANAVTASRVGDSTDTTLSADVSDLLRPALFQFAEADEQGETVVALVPHKDQYLLGFTATETWVLQGDPLSGAIRRVSDQVGIIGADAWCVANDAVYFLSSRGLYVVGADGSGLKALSEDVIPEDLTGVTDAACTLTYQHASRSVFIHKTGTDWCFDTERGGFWPFDTTTAQSHVLIGPFFLADGNAYGRIQNLHGNMATGSANVTWRIVTGDTAEQAAASGKAAIEAAVAGSDYSSYVKSSGVWSAGRSHTAYPRTRAIWAVLWLASSSIWAYEAAAMTRSASGKWR